MNPVTATGTAGRRPGRRTTTQLPLTLVLLVLAAGLLTVRLHHFRIGGLLVGISLLLAGLLRLALSPRAAGLLAVRSRGIDVTVLAALGVVVIGLARVVPAGH